MTGAFVGASLKTYNNSKVRVGEKVTNPTSHAKGYEKWVLDSIQKQIDKGKSLTRASRNISIYKKSM